MPKTKNDSSTRIHHKNQIERKIASLFNDNMSQIEKVKVLVSEQKEVAKNIKDAGVRKFIETI